MQSKSGMLGSVMFLAASLQPLSVDAADVALLLFDGKTGTSFAGCLNCNRMQAESVCNTYGDFGSRFSDTSIWNRFGQFGSRFEENSPWNRFGEGLRVVDQDGNYYGRFTVASYGRSRLPLINQIVEAHEAIDDLEKLRELLCN